VQVTILAPQCWQPAVTAAAADLPPAAASLMAALVRYLHDRHVGIAPGPAGRLALTLLGGRRPVPRGGEADWPAVVARLVDGVLPGGGDGGPAGDGRSGGGRRAPATVVPGSVPFALVDRVVLPLVAAAQHRTGRCCLFGAEGHEVPAGGDAFLRGYEAEQEAALAGVCAGMTDGLPDLFWHHRGMDMAALSRRLAGRGGQVPLPEADAETVALLLRLDPVFAPTAHRVQRSRRPRRASLQPSGVRPREGGVTGIRMTRTMDDMDDMLVSEYTNHPLVLLDRLVNSGFMVRHRPPRRQNRRDVLLVGAMPLGAGDTAGRLAKVCWIDTMARLAPLLQAAGLSNSDFVWLDGNRLGGLAHGFSPLPQGVPLPVGGGGLTPEERVRFVWTLDWLPGLLDRRRAYPPGLEPPEPEDGTDAPSQVKAAGRWTAGALAHALDRPASIAGGEARRLEPGDYGAVHVALMLPRPAAGLEEGEAHSAVFAATRALGLHAGRHQSVSILWFPATGGSAAEWTMACGDGPLRTLAGDPLAGDPPSSPDPARRETDEPDLNQRAGSLVGQWFTHLQEAVLGD